MSSLYPSAVEEDIRRLAVLDDGWDKSLQGVAVRQLRDPNGRLSASGLDDLIACGSIAFVSLDIPRYQHPGTTLPS
jgi:hypothetical protein